MKRQTVNVCAVCVLLLGGCASRQLLKPQQEEIDTYIKAHPDLPDLDKMCIYEGRFQIGMRKETVKFLLGEPKKIETVTQPWAEQTVWYYPRGGKRAFILEGDYVVGIQ